MRKVIALAAAFALAATVGTVDAKPKNKPAKPAKVKKQKPGKPGTSELGIADLAGSAITFKVKTKPTGSQINNFTLWVDNLGDADAQNSRVEFWLSDDNVLTTSVDPLATIPVAVDTLIHTQSLGKIKAGRSKKRTVGGGHLKKLVLLPGQSIFAVVDADNTVVELDELNNILGAPLPVLAPPPPPL
jgi:hypothetical protein